MSTAEAIGAEPPEGTSAAMRAWAAEIASRAFLGHRSSPAERAQGISDTEGVFQRADKVAKEHAEAAQRRLERQHLEDKHVESRGLEEQRIEALTQRYAMEATSRDIASQQFLNAAYARL